MPAPQLSFRKTTLKQSSWQFNLRTKDLLTDRFTHEDSGQEVTIVTDKEIQARNE